MIRRPPRSTLFSLHDALPISRTPCAQPQWTRATTSTFRGRGPNVPTARCRTNLKNWRSEEHTSELQSQSNLVCRLLLEKKKKKKRYNTETKHKYKEDTIRKEL